MFAGAAREAVFARREVADKIRDGFVPIALKAGTVSAPPPGAEMAIYREIARSRPAPQGIAIANGHGKVLAWALSFDGDPQIAAFFDHGADLHARFPGPAGAVATERYRRFPSRRMPDLPDPGVVLDLPGSHGAGDRCAGELRYPPDTFLGRVVGRALDDDGPFKSETRSQETYVEDRFEISAGAQAALAEAARDAGDFPFDVPYPFARALVANAHLGPLDVAPLAGERIGAKVLRDEIALRARRVGEDRLALTGRSAVGGEDVRRGASRGGGPLWSNLVELDWQGTVELAGGRVSRIALIADGHESLEWGSHLPFAAGDPEVANLMSGRRFKTDGRVRYGITGRPATSEEIDRSPGGGPAAARPDPRVHLLNLLGDRYRDLIDTEAHQLQQLLESIADIPDAERPKHLLPYREKLQARLDAEFAKARR